MSLVRIARPRAIKWIALFAALVMVASAVDAAGSRVASDKTTVRMIPSARRIRIDDHGRTYFTSTLPRQIDIDDVHIASDGKTVGWLAVFRDPYSRAAYASALVLWRGGKVVRTFRPELSFYSWTFDSNANQVAYHLGPWHFEVTSNCELRDVLTGRLIAEWNGDLMDKNRPSWTMGLAH